MTEGHDSDDEDVEIITACIFDLMRKDSGDDPFRIFDALAFHTENQFAEPLQRELADGYLSNETKRQLLANPAAPILLAYFVSALLDYNNTNGEFINGPTKASTAVKREALARSLRLVGKSGEKFPTAEERMSLALMFKSALNVALAIERRKLDCDLARIDKAARKAALGQVFRRTYGVEYIYSNDTHRSRMKVLRGQLEHIQPD